ncbi:hypothetical protein COV42_01965 [Candidatus Campbellbacteria bacterium CG11_big_fil_rev_8_21_14_0_20_44_21]|uniref:Uncharacterized protein n=1 Tax=Candidatus Campbellbacteria bacterium CG22_combo_CG10-13_8_21_14_all_43_18 TaxID=1974530 RepID=A0A2H0DVZ3_9BACT|nr:MAG: hypothetical protein COW82_02500 [Candidatus Campbellbacteria bacterium CG22_combo_CG10-13_8_21_14_all_43_18]PIR24193.1 MAG: hypothetical protein COV42_01965 [Candidatus Campbellbacteria bacterium CG11_big_fil_rev_8_21_14_0_20_44_21]
MKKYDTEELNDIFDRLPEPLREAISSVETADKLEDIRKKFGLHVDQAGKLGSETGFVLLGLVPIKEFRRNVKRKLGIDEELTEKIVRAVDEKILSDVRESLKNLTSGPEIIPPKHDEENLNREEVLRELEEESRDEEAKARTEDRPKEDALSPAEAKDFLAGNIERGETAEEKREEKQEQETPPAKEEFFEEKLRSRSEGGFSSAKSEEKKGEIKIIQKSYKGGDPYREPIE